MVKFSLLVVSPSIKQYYRKRRGIVNKNNNLISLYIFDLEKVIINLDINKYKKNYAA